MNRVYFIGAGPGDPDFLTLKGARLLAGCDAVFAPPPFELTFAEHLQGKGVLVPFDYYFDELVEKIRNFLVAGNVAFLVPGDLTFYAPFQALIDLFGEQAVVVPGVGTANVASALLKKTLDLPGVCNRAIIASPRTLGDGSDAPTIGQLAAPGVTLLIYMNNIPLPQLVTQLHQGYGKSVPIAICHRLCLPGEEVVQGTLDDIVAKVGERDFFNLNSASRRPALTLVLVGETLTATVDGAWWDYRREHIWKFRDGEAE
ncbi:SAM-dependent methyltransferase [Trichloromonas sp.]|uniref:SAM-dependent methyltransferase n=1 Tax=Trichloromonas sp. TaxID=3069249 RepID=UPI003D81415E